MKTKQIKQILAGLAVAVGLFGLFPTAHAQNGDWQTHKADNQRIGHNGNPNLFNPGRGFLRWFRPNATDNVAGTVVIDNDAGAIGGFGLIGTWNYPHNPSDEAFFSYTDNVTAGDPPLLTDTVTEKAYYYTRTVASANGTDPTIPQPPNMASSATWTFAGLGATARNYALYVWLPAGQTIENGTGAQLFPQRFFVYEITYGTGQRWIDVVDTSIAGEGWVRLGAGGRGGNQLFPYDGTNPIKIRLVNTVPRDSNGNLSDNPGTTAVYADAAQAVPEIGYYTASPIASLLTGSLAISTFAALNEKTVAIRNNQPTTIIQGVVTSYEYNTSNRRWTFIPALEEPSLSFSEDNNSAGVTFAPPWALQNTGANFRGTDFLDAPVTGNLGGASNVTYNPDTALDDGSYDIYAWLPGDSGTRQFAQALQYEVHEGATITTLTVDQSQNRGWVRLGTRRFNHTNSSARLTVVVTNFSALAGDLTKEAFTDTIRFVGTTNLAVDSTPTFNNALIRTTPNGVPAARDVVIVAGENGRLYCLDAKGRGDTTTDVLWTYPSTPDASNPNWSDPNQVVGEDGPGGIAQMPTSGFNISSALVQRINGQDYLFIAARNGRVYCIDMAGRGDMDLTLRKPGTTRRIWSYPNDYPATPIPSNLGAFSGSLSFADTAAGPTIFVPASQGRMYALDAAAGANKTTAVRWQFPKANQQTLGSILGTPAIQILGPGTGRIYFGTTQNDNKPEPRGEFYALDINTGNVLWMFDGSPASGSAKVADDFLSSPAFVDAVTLGGGMADTVFVANENKFVYALDAATGNVDWQTDELNTGVRAPLTYTPMTVLSNDTTTMLPFPLVLVPTSDGRVSGLFARTTDVNRFNGKLAYEFNTAGDAVTTAVASARTWMYITDNAGYLYALNDTNGILPGQGAPPPGAGPSIPPNDASGDVFRNAKLTFVKRSFYQRLRLRDVPAPDPALPSYAEATNPANWENRNAFEWGETLYIMVYDFPYQILDTDGNTVEPPTINFQISVEGESIRNISQRAKLYRLSTPNTANSGYAILAFPLQGGGANAMPPGSGTITFDITTSALNNSGNQQRIVMNRLTSRKDFRVANPIGMRVFDLAGGWQDYANTNDPTQPQALTNGTPDDPLTLTIREDLMTSPFGSLGHGQAGRTRVFFYDRSMMTILRGPGRGLENVRMQRHDLEWQGGAAAVYKPIDPLLFPNFEEMPVNFPNTSPDYPNIAREHIKVTKDPDNTPENPIYGPVSLIPPSKIGGGQLTEDDVLNRELNPTPFEFELSVPKYQPANGWQMPNSIGVNVPGGYYGRAQVFVDSSGNGILDRVNGRREAFRSLFLADGVSRDEHIVITTPVVDMGSLAPGTGFDPTLPGTAGSTYAPWPNNPLTNPYTPIFKEFTAFNEGNVNILNARLAKATSTGGITTPWAIPAPANHELAWLDPEYHVWTDFDYPTGFNLTSSILIQKPRVGDRIGNQFVTNPIRRENPNTGAIQGPLLASPTPGNPRIGVTIPIGMPVGTYTQLMRVIEDGWTWDEGAGRYIYLPADADSALKLSVNGSALEAYSDPTFTLTFKVREDRGTTTFTQYTYPMIDDLVPGGSTPTFMHKNLAPSGLRTFNGDLLMAYTSTRSTFTSPLPTEASLNDKFRIYIASLDGQSTSPNQGRSPMEPLNYFAKPAGTPRFWSQEVGPYPVPDNPSAGQLAPLFLPGAGETVLADTVKFGAAAFPSNGTINPFSSSFNPSLYLGFVGEAQVQTPSGRIAVSHLFIASTTIDTAGKVTIGAPIVYSVDPQVSKSRPALIQSGNQVTMFYGSTGTGRGQLYWAHYNGSAWNNPTAIPLGEGFESVSASSAYGRLYKGLNSGGGGSPVIELTFAGKLRSRPNSEIFYCRLNSAGDGTPQGGPILLPKITDNLVGEPGGLFTAQGLAWDPRQTILLEQSLDGGTTWTDLEVAGTRRRDSGTGLISFQAKLGGQLYLDPSMGTVRFGSANPIKNAILRLTYSPRFMRVSGAKGAAGHGSPSILVDNRRVGAIDYWARPDNSAAQASDDIHATRFIFTYTRGASGEGLTTRPYMRTARFGIQLDHPIFTNADGTIPPGGLVVTGATSFFQVNPANGRIYFTDADENRTITVQYTAVDEATGGSFAVPSQAYDVGLVRERSEAPIGIEQAVNETQMCTSLDEWDAPNTLANPGLIWMFWSSTRAGTPDIFFQTIAPRFTPVAKRG